MALAEPLHALLADGESGPSKELVGEQATAHADLAMNAPDRELNTFGVEGLVPRKDVLINTIDQRPIEV
jgi:hypothetical protein